jgi:hypothetical protein
MVWLNENKNNNKFQKHFDIRYLYLNKIYIFEYNLK